ncbi:hypothetical protein PR202_gb06350 [Eleusine coracana subsp. coracana]|uniref:VQ domain-containing protein n=1 Tax=Eleusine coracana subsp. coracana TaxID=191504 RepID=A0AAV5E8N4_ELECO|nr:hypothetical protein QOZ80_2BG0156420 [Eleusine coracana subsp. coracana]GJN19112.1 hypothetical protein PR202_gb06350 [Eleusine coracana subsp. coracana]
MGDAGGNMAHWAGLYGGGGAPAAEATVVTTAVSSPTSGGSGGSPSRPSGGPGVEGGRVGKPARRRSRASRRAPVTLLNTDTANFRAMVQQFTGIPAGPYGPGGPVISFGPSAGAEYGGASSSSLPVRPSPTSAVMSFDHHHHQMQQQHRAAPPTSLQGQLFRPQPQQQYGGGYDGGGDMSSFLHGFESSSVEDRMLLQSIQAAQMMPTRPASTNNTNGYNFG